MIRAILALLTIAVLLGTVFAVSENSASAYNTKWNKAPKICGDKICDTRNTADNEKERQDARDKVKPVYEAPVEPEPEAEPEEAMEETMMEEKMMEKEMTKEKMRHGWQTSSGTIN